MSKLSSAELIVGRVYILISTGYIIKMERKNFSGCRTAGLRSGKSVRRPTHLDRIIASQLLVADFI